MNRRFDLKGWGPILAAALFGIVLGTSGVSVLWPQMWEGVKLSDSLGFWGGIFGGAMTLVAAIIAFRPARDQVLIAKANTLSADVDDLERIARQLSDVGSNLDAHMVLISTALPAPPPIFTMQMPTILAEDEGLMERIRAVRTSSQDINRIVNSISAASVKFYDYNDAKNKIWQLSKIANDYYVLNIEAVIESTRPAYQFRINRVRDKHVEFLTAQTAALEEIKRILAARAEESSKAATRVGRL